METTDQKIEDLIEQVKDIENKMENIAIFAGYSFFRRFTLAVSSLSAFLIIWALIGGLISFIKQYL